MYYSPFAGWGCIWSCTITWIEWCEHERNLRHVHHLHRELPGHSGSHRFLLPFAKVEKVPTKNWNFDKIVNLWIAAAIVYWWSYHVIYCIQRSVISPCSFADYSCALSKDYYSQHGAIYITTNFICFRANIFGQERKLILPIEEVQQIIKVNTFRLIPSGIVVVTSNNKVNRLSIIYRSYVPSINSSPACSSVLIRVQLFIPAGSGRNYFFLGKKTLILAECSLIKLRFCPRWTVADKS